MNIFKQFAFVGAIVLVNLSVLAEDVTDSATPKPASYSASLSGGKTIELKASDFNLYLLLTLSSVASKSDSGSAAINITVKNGAKIVTLNKSMIAYTYKVSVDKKSKAAKASGKGAGLTFAAESDSIKSTLTLKLDISAVVAQLPQVKGKPTLVGTSQFTLAIGSATFVGTVDSKGKVTF